MSEQYHFGSSRPAMLNKKDGWFRFCRPYLEELNPRDDLDLVPYVRDMVARAKVFKADTLVMMADDGGYPLYPSAMAPINPHIHGQDLLGMIEQECRKKGLRFGLGYLGVHTNSYITATRPDWAMRQESGETFGFFNSNLLCPNSPYGRYYTDLIGEALGRYAVDYLYVEGLYFRKEGCHCAFCKEKFRSAFGKQLAEANPTERVAFMIESITAFMAALKTESDKVSPQTAVVGTSYLNMFGVGDVTRFSRNTDMVAIENQWGAGFEGFDIRPFYQAGFDIRLHRALSNKPVVGTWWASHNVDMNYHQRSEAHAKLTFMQTLANGGGVQPHIQSVFEFQQSLQPTMRELFACVERVRDYLLDATFLPHIAVVEGPHAIGYCYTLSEHHLPYDLITPHNIERAQLGAHKAVILGDAKNLNKEAVSELAAYVESGGGLICAGQISDDLAAWIGLELDGEIDSGQGGLPLYFRFVTEDKPWSTWCGRFFSFYSRCARVHPSSAYRTVAQIIGLDTERMHEDHMGIKPYPGAPLGPMVLMRTMGKGRVLYFAGDLANAAIPGNISDADVTEILAQGVHLAASDSPPLTTNAPPSVELITHVKQDRMAVFMLNQTINQIGANCIIRYVVPLYDLEVRVRVIDEVTSVTTISGRPVHYQVDNGWLMVRVPRLEEYEVLLVNYKKVIT